MNFSEQSEAGFTLIELIVVVVVLTALLMIVTPSVRQWRLNADYRDAARRVANFLQEGRNQSISQGIAHTVTCTPATSNCTVATVAYNDAGKRFDVGTLVGNYTFPESTVMKTGAACDQDTAVTVEYFPNGSAEITPAGVDFNVCVKTAAGATRFVVALESAATGKVSITRP